MCTDSSWSTIPTDEPDNEFEVSETDPSTLAIVGRFCVAFVVATIVWLLVVNILPIYDERLLRKVEFAVWLSTMFTLMTAWNIQGWKDVARSFVEWVVFASGLVLVSIGLDIVLGF
jgi:hypothetical protein